MASRKKKTENTKGQEISRREFLKKGGKAVLVSGGVLLVGSSLISNCGSSSDSGDNPNPYLEKAVEDWNEELDNEETDS